MPSLEALIVTFVADFGATVPIGNVPLVPENETGLVTKAKA